MALHQRLEHSQKGVFTQSLRQSMKILELPLLELIENPVIEEAEKNIKPLGEFMQTRIESDEDAYEKAIPGKRESLTEALLRQLRINAADAEFAQRFQKIPEFLPEEGVNEAVD